MKFGGHNAYEQSFQGYLWSFNVFKQDLPLISTRLFCTNLKTEVDISRIGTLSLNFFRNEIVLLLRSCKNTLLASLFHGHDLNECRTVHMRAHLFPSFKEQKLHVAEEKRISILRLVIWNSQHVNFRIATSFQTKATLKGSKSNNNDSDVVC